MPKGRSGDYAIWKACERFGLRPPSIKHRWEDNNMEAQTLLIAYDQIRSVEEIELLPPFRLL